MAETAAKPPNVINPERFAFVLLALGIAVAAFAWWLLTSEIWEFDQPCGSALGGPNWWEGHSCHGRRGPRLGWGIALLCGSIWLLMRAARARWGRRWLWQETTAGASVQ